MATYLSAPYQGSEYVSGVPIDLISKVGMMKQMRYEQNIADIQGLLDATDQSDIIKDSERGYLQERLREVTGRLNQFVGHDFSDRNVANQLKSYTQGLLRDQRIFNAVADTKLIRKNISILNDIKENKPEEYAAQNEKLFMDEVNSYVNGDPGKRYSGQGYIPYYNYDKAYREATKQVLDNPDIQREILYSMMPNGTRVARGEREVKEVTQQKIAQGLLAVNDQRAYRQMMIDYQATLPNKTMGSAIGELDGHLADQKAVLAQVKGMLNKGIKDSEQQQAATNMAKSLEGGEDIIGVIPQLEDKIREIKESGDPSRYYTFEKYTKDYIDGLSKSYAFQQKGKIETDDLFIEGLRQQNRVSLEKLRSSLKIQEETAKKQLEAAMPNSYETPVTIGLKNLLFSSSKATNMPESFNAAALGGYDNKDGSYTISNTDTPVFLNVFKELEKNGIEEKNLEKIRGYNQLLEAYSKWTSTKDGRYSSNSSTTPHTVGPLGAQIGVTYNRVEKPISEYLKTNAGRQFSERVKSQTGVDLNNEADRENIEILSNSVEASEMVQIGNVLTKALKGSLKVRFSEGENFLLGNDGNYYVNMYTEMTEDDISRATGRNFDILSSKGLIQSTGNTNSKGKELYMIPLTKRVNKDLMEANTDYLLKQNSSDKFFSEKLPSYTNKFVETNTAVANLNTVNDKNLIDVTTRTISKYSQNKMSQIEQEQLMLLREKVDKSAKILQDPSVNSNTKLQAKNFLIEVNRKLSNE